MKIEEQLKKAFEELRKNEQRKFNQTVDLIINLQKFDLKRNAVNIFVHVPHKIKNKKIAAFLEAHKTNVETITKNDFKKYSDKKELKKLSKKFDFFIAQASMMPSVATTFGRFLGPSGKMPSPQLGIMVNATDKEIEDLKNKINNSARVRTKDSSIKLGIGKQDMKDSELIDNIMAIYNAVIKVLPRGNDNVKNMEVKFTMTKPVKISIK